MKWYLDVKRIQSFKLFLILFGSCNLLKNIQEKKKSVISGMCFLAVLLARLTEARAVKDLLWKLRLFHSFWWKWLIHIFILFLVLQLQPNSCTPILSMNLRFRSFADRYPWHFHRPTLWSEPENKRKTFFKRKVTVEELNAMVRYRLKLPTELTLSQCFRHRGYVGFF